jgi:hypothetical protein
VLSHQRTDSTERGILGKVVRRVRVMDVRRYTTGPDPLRVIQRTLRREGQSSGSEGLLKSYLHVTQQEHVTEVP